MLLIALAIFIPISANAACESSIDVDINIELDNKNAIFDTGSNVNVLMKTLADRFKNKATNVLYHGLVDIILNKVVFNTDTEVKLYILISILKL